VTESGNVELVRSIFAAWERGDFRSTDWADPKIEFVIADGPSPGSWVGVAGMAEGFGGWFSAWAEYRLDAEAYLELDDSSVLAPLSVSGRGKLSGLNLGEMHTRSANLFHLRNGRVTRLVIYFDRDRAFAELGVEAGGDAP
jgi:ketosteroid isomerase-like protein